MRTDKSTKSVELFSLDNIQDPRYQDPAFQKLCAQDYSSYFAVHDFNFAINLLSFMLQIEKKMTRNHAGKRMTAHFTMQIVFVLCTSQMVFLGEEDVNSDILKCVDILMNVFKETSI